VYQVSFAFKSDGDDGGCSVMIYQEIPFHDTIMRLSLIGQAAL
jgi:hypothetical protein